MHLYMYVCMSTGKLKVIYEKASHYQVFKKLERCKNSEAKSNNIFANKLPTFKLKERKLIHFLKRFTQNK